MWSRSIKSTLCAFPMKGGRMHVKHLLHVLFPLMLLCLCASCHYVKTPSEKNMSDVLAELDSMINQFAKESDTLLDEDSDWESDTLIANCYDRALTAISHKYGEESEEMLACLKYAADNLSDDDTPFSQKVQYGYSCYEKALSISMKMYGNTSIAVGNCYADLVYASGQDSDNAKLYADSALAILVPKCGNSSKEVAYVYINLGDSYLKNSYVIYHAAAQSQMLNDSDDFSVEDYEEINSILELSLANYRKASDIYKELSEKDMDEYKELTESLKEDIQNIEDEIKQNNEILVRLKSNTTSE